jgi:hypothetical protein
MKTSHLEFSRGLLTPRKDIAELSPGVSRSELVTSQRLRRIEGVYLSSERQFTDRTEAADEVGQLVRHTLLFGSLASTGRLWSRNAETDSVETNCFGHSIVASELMDELEIPHTISFVNGHSFITLFDGESDQAHMVDPPSKNLFLDIDGLVHGTHSLQQLQNATEHHQVATNIIDTEGLMARIPRKPRAQLIEEHPWLSIGSTMSGVNQDTQTGFDKTQLIMRTYLPETGRQVLQYYGMVGQRMLEREYLQAAEEAGALFGLYPELDARNKLAPAVTLRHELGRLGAVEAMQDLAAVIDSSLWYGDPTEDRTANRYFWLDTLRHIGSKFEDPELIEIARDGYKDLTTVIPSARHKAHRATIMANRLTDAS